LIWNFAPHRTGGHANGVVISSEGSENSDNILVQMKALDPPYDDKGRPEKVPPLPLVSKKSKRIVLSPGDLSEFRPIHVFLANNASDYPDKFLKTPLGMGFANITEAINAIDQGLKIVKERGITDAKIAEQMVNSEVLDQYTTFTKDMFNSVVTEQVKENLNKDESK